MSAAAAIPAYEAAPTVGEVIRGCLEHVEDVLVVDDGSHDETAAAAAAAGARVVRHAHNQGKGRALRTAFDDLFGRGHEHVATLDADGQHLTEELPRLLDCARVSGAELVIGSRRAQFVEMHPLRRASNRVSTALIAAAAGALLTDVQSGFRVYARRLVMAVGFPEPGFEAESAVVVRAVRCGFRVREVQVRVGVADGRTTSHYRALADSARIAVAVTRARLEVLRWPSS
jgi:glycosyltransferase involved in cell wall biosynthesis